jgi:hypothetical protein
MSSPLFSFSLSPLLRVLEVLDVDVGRNRRERMATSRSVVASPQPASAARQPQTAMVLKRRTRNSY